jgi:ubiquinone/menaquinone biosynthesis C-methylase UbiE
METLELQLKSEQIKQQWASPVLFFETMHAYQRSAALKTAIELELFTAIGETSGGVGALTERIGCPERGLRALCDFLVVIGFLNKYIDESGEYYSLTLDSAAFLHKKSPRYIGMAISFMAAPFLVEGFKDLTRVIREGGPPPDGHSVNQELPLWVDFARSMAPLMFSTAEQAAKLLSGNSEAKILDIAAGHGLFGIAVARANPKAKIVALDFPSVLTVARENVEHFGVADRVSYLEGDALVIPFGTGFDGVLVPNLLHHWDRQTNVDFLRKVHAALKPGGRVVVVEFAPNDDRVSPPIPASFVMNMLVSTPGGNAYTLSENLAMLEEAGFSSCESVKLLPTPETAIVGVKK